MNKKLLFVLAVVSVFCILLPFQRMEAMPMPMPMPTMVEELMPTAILNYEHPITADEQIVNIKKMLLKSATSLNITVINKVLAVLSCASTYHIENEHILTIIDYSLPSSEKRLWVFDLVDHKLLFHTYVSHGIKSGVLLSNYFSNKNDSKASSIGVYKTDKPYYGRHGLSLKLDGLEYGFNDNADSRAVVMHGGWYVNEKFIKKYGRAGRSWGCPAVPSDLTEPIINTIKDNSLFVAYYPSDNWFIKSKFLKCELHPSAHYQTGANQSIGEIEERDDILFADLHKNNQFTDSDPVVVMPADHYEQMFHIKAPLTRMLRRQINEMEYVALNSNELKNIATNSDVSTHDKTLYFVIPDIKMVRGYYATEMKLVNFGNITDIKSNVDKLGDIKQASSYTIHFSTGPTIDIKSSKRFIRWIGL